MGGQSIEPEKLSELKELITSVNQDLKKLRERKSRFDRQAQRGILTGVFAALLSNQTLYQKDSLIGGAGILSGLGIVAVFVAYWVHQISKIKQNREEITAKINNFKPPTNLELTDELRGKLGRDLGSILANIKAMYLFPKRRFSNSVFKLGKNLGIPKNELIEWSTIMRKERNRKLREEKRSRRRERIGKVFGRNNSQDSRVLKAEDPVRE